MSNKNLNKKLWGKKICICIYTAQNAALTIYVNHFQIQEKKQKNKTNNFN